MKTLASTIAAALFLSLSAIAHQDQDVKSPDLQKERHPETAPLPQANQPGTNHPTAQAPQPSTNHDPDQQQDSGARSPSHGKRKKHKNDVHQAHGKPNPSATKE